MRSRRKGKRQRQSQGQHKVHWNKESGWKETSVDHHHVVSSSTVFSSCSLFPSNGDHDDHDDEDKRRGRKRDSEKKKKRRRNHLRVRWPLDTGRESTRLQIIMFHLLLLWFPGSLLASWLSLLMSLLPWQNIQGMTGDRKGRDEQL